MTTTRSPNPRAKRAQRAYHHGNLRQAMIDAAVQLVEEGGVETVTTREAARRAGVSSGAPFRHFANKVELITAVAEDGMAKLRGAIVHALTGCRSKHPLVRLMAVAEAYFDWATENPTHYRVLGDRSLVHFYQSEALVGDNAATRVDIAALFQSAHEAGLLRRPDLDLDLIHLQSRALAYGLTRMHVDGHFKEFGITPAAAKANMRRVMRDYLLSLASDPAALERALAKR